MAPTPEENVSALTQVYTEPLPGEEICVTGCAGSFPESNSVKELGENLFNKMDLITDDDRRWKHTDPEIPHRTGKIYNLDKFDATFFGVNHKKAHTMDPMARVLFEAAYESIIDAGYNPAELRGNKIGVYVGVCFSESDQYMCYEKVDVNDYGITGNYRAMLAANISHWLGVTGPAYSMDTACSSSLYAVEHAVKAIRAGVCDAAIVAGVNSCLHPIISHRFARLGVLSPDGKCKSFDNSANGYARAETIAACFIQKAKDSRRVYAQIIHAKTNCDGYKEQGITYPSGDIQRQLLETFYDECKVNPHELEFFEAHGTGTQVGDPEELKAIDAVCCTGRDRPLLIGSVKSNLGHAEGAAGICAMSKLVIAYFTGFIPPNIHYNTPREGVEGLIQGRLEVVTEKRPWGRGLAGISSFGFGGGNAHVLLNKYARAKINNGLPSDDLPRLICVSGRTENSINKIFNDMESRTVDVEEIALWHSIHAQNIDKHAYRGYAVLGSTPRKSLSLARNQNYVFDFNRPVWLIYSGLHSEWPVVDQLIKLPAFVSSMQKSHEILKSFGVELLKLVENKTECSEKNLNNTVRNIAVQVALTDVMKAAGVNPDHITGVDIGELSAAYADGTLTHEQVIIAAFNVGKILHENKINTTNADNFNVLSARLIKALKEIITHPKTRSEKMQVTTSEFKTMCAEYFMEKLLKQNVTNEIINKIQENAVVIKVGLLAEETSKAKDIVTVNLVKRNVNSLVHLLTSLGKIYEAGIDLQIANIYPKVQFPVSQGTPMISHLIEWDHRETWLVAPYHLIKPRDVTERLVILNIEDDESEFLTGHCIDGRNLYPATGYLVLVWETLALIYGVPYTDLSVVFENVGFHRATTIPKESDLEFTISIQRGSGNFEISENGVTIVTGRIYAKKNVSKEFKNIPEVPKDKTETGTGTMSAKDFYKELNLRGYQYKDMFRGVAGSNIEGTKGRIFWENNWITFLDNMLQPIILTQDTRSLYVPTRIEKLSIDVDVHNSTFAQIKAERSNNIDDDVKADQKPKSLSEKQMNYEFQVYPKLNVIRLSGIELRGLHVTGISKKPPLGIPVYEKNEFIPNYSNDIMKIEDVLRTNIQIIFENIHSYKFKCIELVDEEYKTNNMEPIIENIGDILDDLPLVQADLNVISAETLKLSSRINVADKKITGETNAIIFTGANLLERPKILQEAMATLKDNCFLLTREQITIEPKDYIGVYDIITVYNTGTEYLVMLRIRPTALPATYIKVVTADSNFSWIEKVKEEMKEAKKIVLYTEKEKINGLLGLVNCLRREPGGEIVTGVLIDDPNAPAFDPELSVYKDQLLKGLGMNVYKNGQWGTYRHLLLENLPTVPSEHAFVNTTTIGDLSSLSWLQGDLSMDYKPANPRQKLVHVYCSALNFRDVMTAMGRVTLDAVARGRLAQECVQGIEISGRTSSGVRVMAVCERGISNLVLADESCLYPIPDEWSFEEAVTVPVTYSTVFMAMVVIGKIKKGESILIHAGSGGVGQAAINVALHYGLEVFTTVGTPEKRDFVKKMFPTLKDNHIGNSRDTSFAKMIKQETNGRGVDLVLNSLADDKLQASVKCLTWRGRFLEIGKYDITNNTKIQMCFLKKEISFHGVMLDFISDPQCEPLRVVLRDLMLKGIASGAVRPLTYCTFEKDQVEPAYRYMAAGKHIGKVIIKIRDSDHTNDFVKPTPQPINAVHRYTCSREKVYIILGGLGGFGLELVDWLIIRGARKLVLTSRRGVSNGYQAMKLKIWASYGVDIKITTHDVTTESGCEQMLKEANSMGPVEAIFNLAVILKDAVFQNQTVETFKTSYGPKAQATINLDKLSRKLCPVLKDFVIFSSVSCGRGNAGQTNYGFSNSVMERICEERKKEGLPALAIQWGAIGDVGLVADMQEENIQLEIGGTLQQRIVSCLQAMDKFMKQDAAIVSSIVVAEKKTGGSSSDTCVDAVAAIMGIRDMKTISHQAALAELGMDSIMAVEIKQTLERDFEIFLSAQEIRTLTFAKLMELSTSADQGEQPVKIAAAAGAVLPPTEFKAGLGVLVRNFGDEKLVNEPYIFMKTRLIEGVTDKLTKKPIIFLLPGMESCAGALEVLCSKLNARACVLQLGLDINENANIETLTDKLYKHVKPRLTPGAPFYLLGYSFGTLPMMNLAGRLENEGLRGVVFCIDGSPDYMKAVKEKVIDVPNDNMIENKLLENLFKMALPQEINAIVMKEIEKFYTLEEKVKFALSLSPDSPFSYEFLINMTKVITKRLKIVANSEETNSMRVKSPMVLIRPKEAMLQISIAADYGLSKHCEGEVALHYLETDHIDIVENDDCVRIINETIEQFSNNILDKTSTKVFTNLIETNHRTVNI